MAKPYDLPWDLIQKGKYPKELYFFLRQSGVILKAFGGTFPENNSAFDVFVDGDEELLDCVEAIKVFLQYRIKPNEKQLADLEYIFDKYDVLYMRCRLANLRGDFACTYLSFSSCERPYGTEKLFPKIFVEEKDLVRTGYLRAKYYPKMSTPEESIAFFFSSTDEEHLLKWYPVIYFLCAFHGGRIGTARELDAGQYNWAGNTKEEFVKIMLKHLYFPTDGSVKECYYSRTGDYFDLNSGGMQYRPPDGNRWTNWEFQRINTFVEALHSTLLTLNKTSNAGALRRHMIVCTKEIIAVVEQFKQKCIDYNFIPTI